MSARHAGRKRKAGPITLPALASVPVADRPKLARARLQAVASPRQFDARHEGGAVVIEQKLPLKLRPDDRLTPERRRHAEEADLLVTMDSFRTESGEQTQLKRQRLVSPVEQLWKAGVIDADEFGAVRRFQRDIDMATMSGPATAVRYEPRGIDGGGQRFLMPAEAQVHHQARVEGAQRACGPKLAQMLRWIAIEPCGWRQAAKERFPGASERFARTEFKRLLRLACAALESHYRRR